MTVFRAFICLFHVISITHVSISLYVNTTALEHSIQQLSSHSSQAPPGISRVHFTAADISARAFIRSEFRSAGLFIHEDPIGNIFGKWTPEGTAHLPSILTGSHFDALPHSGAYDGTYGVLGAVQAIHAIRNANLIPKAPLEIVAFTSEEPTRFGLSCIGSRALSGAISVERLGKLRDVNNVSLEEARISAGCKGSLKDVAVSMSAEKYAAFLELHIEQASSLEKEAVDIGAVTAIAAPMALRISVAGEGGHAGTVRMAERRDALAAAAEITLAVERAAKEDLSSAAVGTVGEIKVFPGLINSIPSRVELGVDIRHVSIEGRARMMEKLRMEIKRVEGERNVHVNLNIVNEDVPLKCDEDVVKIVEKAAENEGLSVKKTISGAYHDSLFMGRLYPTGMIFVPCRNGISHTPEEFVETRSLRNGVATLARALLLLADRVAKERERKISTTSGMKTEL